VDLGFEYETLCVHQDVALAALDLLATIVTALLCATLDRLGINQASAGLCISVQANPQAFSYSPVDPFPGTVDAPGSEVVVNGRPSREVVGKQAPLTTAFEDVEDGVHDLTKIVSVRPSMPLGGRQVRLYVIPFDIGKIRWVRFSHTC
jgi:hypothetical protein